MDGLDWYFFVVFSLKLLFTGCSSHNGEQGL